MINLETWIKVSDNSGASFVKCINLGRGFKKRKVFFGDIIKVSVKKLKKLSKKIIRKKMYKALVIRVSRKIKRPAGDGLKLNNNGVLILSEKEKLLGTRIYGSVPKELRKGLFKIKYRHLSSFSDGVA